MSKSVLSYRNLSQTQKNDSLLCLFSSKTHRTTPRLSRDTLSPFFFSYPLHYTPDPTLSGERARSPIPCPFKVTHSTYPLSLSVTASTPIIQRLTPPTYHLVHNHPPKPSSPNPTNTKQKNKKTNKKTKTKPVAIFTFSYAQPSLFPHSPPPLPSHNPFTLVITILTSIPLATLSPHLQRLPTYTSFAVSPPLSPLTSQITIVSKRIDPILPN